MFKYFNRGISTPIAIGIIAVLVVVVGGGILAYQYKKEQPNIQTQTTETPAPITESSDWKKYTDNNFGYSFYYPKTWKVSSTDSRVTITNFGKRNELCSDSISISEVQGSGVVDMDSKFGNTTLYYDDNSKQWMKTSPGANEEYETKPAKVAFNTISGLSAYSSTGRWKTVIIPLSHAKFLVVNITGSGYTIALDLLASAITETNANVSVSAIEKIIADMMTEIVVEEIKDAVRYDSVHDIEGEVWTITQKHSRCHPEHSIVVMRNNQTGEEKTITERSLQVLVEPILENVQSIYEWHEPWPTDRRDYWGMHLFGISESEEEIYFMMVQPFGDHRWPTVGIHRDTYEVRTLPNVSPMQTFWKSPRGNKVFQTGTSDDIETQRTKPRLPNLLFVGCFDTDTVLLAKTLEEDEGFEQFHFGGDAIAITWIDNNTIRYNVYQNNLHYDPEDFIDVTEHTLLRTETIEISDCK